MTVDQAIQEAERQRANLTRQLAHFDDGELAAPIVAEITALG